MKLQLTISVIEELNTIFRVGTRFMLKEPL
jgi:hypothetical protein